VKRTSSCFVVVAGILTLLCPARGNSSPQVSLRVSPVVWIPLGNMSGLYNGGEELDYYSTGYGADLAADFSMLDFLSPYVDAGVAYIPTNNVSNGYLLFARGGLGLSAFVYPLPRMMLRAGGSGGMGYASSPRTGQTEASQGMASYWKVRAEIGYRFSPTFSLLANAGYSQILGSATTIYKGISAGLSFNIGLDKLGGGSRSVTTEILRQETLSPIAYYKSEKAPIAVLRLVNEESAEIRDVRVGFAAGVYTSREAECATFPLIQRKEGVDVPIYAIFNEKVLGFSELTKLQGDIRVDYKILNAGRSASKAITVVFNNRNAATWVDDRVVGAFVSPQDPAMLELSKYLAGLVRVHARPEIDKYLQYGMGLFEGLRVYGIVHTADPNLPYAEARKDKTKIAYLQYPYQTLSYKSGDCDAIALAVAEALESVAVPAGVVPLPEDMLVAFPLAMPAAQARTAFGNPQMFIFEGETAWVPLRASFVRDGFLRAWQAGAELWRKHESDAESPRIVPIEEAWKEFQPIALADVEFRPAKPSEDAVVLAFENVLGRFVTAEVEPKARRLRAGFEGEGTGRQLNGLGIVYAQYGLYEEARAQFQKAVDKGNGAALVNLANVAFLLKDYETAAIYFEKVLAGQPDNKAAMIGLARTRYELDNFAQADDLFSRVKAIDPQLAKQYSYLASEIDAGQAIRASSAAADRGGGMLWESGE
jgi:tetratricopeptide (TPR) repeat protein